MSHEARWSHRAGRDLIRIVDYLHQRDLDWAAGVLDAINEKIELISNTPFLSSVYDRTEYLEIREVLAANYRVFFTVSEHDNEVRILHIRHASQLDPEFAE